MSIEINQTERPTNIITRMASGVIGARKFVKIDGAVCGQGERALGVNREETKDGLPMAVMTDGTMLVVCGEPLNDGDEVTSGPTGRAHKPVGGEYINGVALHSQPEVGHLVEIQFGGAVKAEAGLTTTTTTTTTTAG